jgi:flagellar motor switch protein FliG
MDYRAITKRLVQEHPQTIAVVLAHKSNIPGFLSAGSLMQ